MQIKKNIQQQLQVDWVDLCTEYRRGYLSALLSIGHVAGTKISRGSQTALVTTTTIKTLTYYLL